MESVYNFNPAELLAFSLVLLRMIAFVVTMPIIGSVNVPTSAKILFALLMSFILFPQVGWNKLHVDVESLSIMTLAIKELFIGLTFGFLARMFFMAITMAGQIMSVSMGISSAQLFNPAMGDTSAAMDQFFVTLASLFFFAIQGHHVFIKGIFDTFQIVPLDQMTISFDAFASLGGYTQAITAIALKISAPILVSILFMNLAIAVVGRAVPQINILITSMPINVLAGFLVLFVSLPLLIWQMQDLLNFTAEELFTFIKTY